MNVNRYVFASLAAFAFVFAFDFLLHGTFLHSIYQETQHLWRPEGETNMAMMVGSELLFSLMFTCMYSRYGVGQNLKEGGRFGLCVGLIFAAVTLGTYCYMPIPFVLTASWMIGDLLRCSGAGVVAALIYKK